MVAKGAFGELAVAGNEISVRVTPGASGESLTLRDGQLLARVTVVAESGKANKAVTKLVARGLGIAPGRLVLKRGSKSRDKLFVVSP